MSYDIYFLRDKPLEAAEFQSYFAGRPHYEMNGDQAWYNNEDSGVYFSLERADPEDEEDSELDAAATFNMNLFRPHFFALEAAPEVQAFIQHFGFEFHDPQLDGMAHGPFSTDGFIRGWNKANQFAYRALFNSEEAPDTVHARPTAQLEAVWRWNLAKEGIQSSLGEDVFVPRISWTTVDGQLASAVVWPDGIATLIPQVEMLIIGREELAPTRLFRRQKDSFAIPQTAVDGVLASFESGVYPLPCRVPQYAVPPESVKQFVRGLPSDSRALQVLSADTVLNQELVDAARHHGS